jgi:hypothetical protein
MGEGISRGAWKSALPLKPSWLVSSRGVAAARALLEGTRG